MKNQHAGDANDFCRYGILRALTAKGATTSTVVWMLTTDDLSRDGRKLAYLFRAPSVGFFLAAQRAATDTYRSRALELASKWKGTITVSAGLSGQN